MQKLYKVVCNTLTEQLSPSTINCGKIEKVVCETTDKEKAEKCLSLEIAVFKQDAKDLINGLSPTDKKGVFKSRSPYNEIYGNGNISGDFWFRGTNLPEYFETLEDLRNIDLNEIDEIVISEGDTIIECPYLITVEYI